MAFEPKDNSGAIFAAREKKNPNWPDREGSAMIGGVEYWVSGWLKTDKAGKPFLSLAFKPKEQRNQPAPRGSAGSAPARDESSDIPF